MEKNMKKYLLLFLLLLPCLATAGNIEIVVPFPPGGATDTLGRIAAQALSESGDNAIVLNKPGANNVIAANYVAHARKDGNTLFVGATGALDANLVYGVPDMNYNEHSFAPIIKLGTISYVLVVPIDSLIHDYQDYVRYVRAYPDKFVVGFWNANTANVFYAWANKEHLPRPTIVIYKGSGPEMLDLLGNHIFSTWDTWLKTKPLVESKKVRVIAVLDSAGLHDVQTAEPNVQVFSVGKKYPDLDMQVWYGLWAPAGTDSARLEHLNAILNKAFNKKEYKDKFQKLTVGNYGGTAKELLDLRNKNLGILKNIKNNK